jgi:predicted metal-dependent hydrolase
MQRANEIANLRKPKTLSSLKEMASAQQIIELTKRRTQEDDLFKNILQLFSQDGALSYRINNVSESKLKVLATIYRKLLKVNDDSLQSEVLYTLQNRVDSRS